MGIPNHWKCVNLIDGRWWQKTNLHERSCEVNLHLHAMPNKNLKVAKRWTSKTLPCFRTIFCHSLKSSARRQTKIIECEEEGLAMIRAKSSMFSHVRSNSFFRMLWRALQSNKSTQNLNASKRHTSAVVLLHVLKATSAASMARFVSATPISGTVPNSSSLAGSDTPISSCHYATFYSKSHLLVIV